MHYYVFMQHREALCCVLLNSAPKFLGIRSWEIASYIFLLPGSSWLLQGVKKQNKTKQKTGRGELKKTDL